VITKDDSTPATAFHNVQVTATPSLDPSTGKVIYTTTFDPESLTITTHDAVLNYQLVAPTPEGVQFKDVKFKQKVPQLSTPSIGLSGKIVTFSDQNTSQEAINLTFYFVDQDLVEFQVDPIVENEPPPH
jgi:hypothetical protein